MTANLTHAEIIAVGSELLEPGRAETNSSDITARLAADGIETHARTVVGDVRGDLAAVLRAALDRATLVVLAGGLGPTDDDITREVAAQVLGLGLREDRAVLASIEARFAGRGLPMAALNRRQAFVIEGARILPNPNGTAPGQWIETPSNVVVLLPGPPREMRPMLDVALSAHLGGRGGPERVFRRLVRVAGRTESGAEEVARTVYAQWVREALPIRVTVLANRGSIDFHLALRWRAELEANTRLDEAARVLQAAFGDDAYSASGESLERVVGNQLRDRGWRLAVAESCTGGLVAARLTDVAGSSAYLAGGVVAYSNAMKIALLGVPPEALEAHGAVSEPVAVAMAEGVRRLAAVELGLGVTGIAGPHGGTPDKPVGQVVFAVADPAGTIVRMRRLPGDRALVRQFATTVALDLIRRRLAGTAG